jgi:hypothetical protein
MVFFTSLNILDTGFLAKSVRSSQLATANRAYSGAAFTLKGVTLTINSSGNLDKTTPPAKFTASQHALVSINPRTFIITIYVGANYTSTSNIYGVNDVAMLPELLRLPETAGWKAIYVPVDISSAAGYLKRESHLIYAIGSADTSEGQGDLSFSVIKDGAVTTTRNLTYVKYLCARFETCQLGFDPSTPNAIRVTLSGVFTA